MASYLDKDGLSYFWGKVKANTPSKTSDLTNDSNFSSVSWSQNTSTGTNIASITINGTTTQIYAPSGGGTTTFQRVFYGYCTTAANTMAKIVSCDDFDGYSSETDYDTLIGIFFENGNGLQYGTLNINDTGAVDFSSDVPTDHGITWFTYNVTHDEWVQVESVASTSNYGITKLTNSYSSTSTDTAATPAAVRTAYNLANSKSTVSFTRSLTSGTQIGTITINGSSTTIYAPMCVVEFDLDNDACDTTYAYLESVLTGQQPVPIVVRAILNQGEVYMTSNIYKDYGQGEDIIITFMRGLDYFKLTYTSNGAINYTGWESLTNADTTSY